jgi:hypothetical protein
VRRTVGSNEISEPVTIIKCEVDDDSLGFNDGIGEVSGTLTLDIKAMTNNNFGNNNNNEASDCVVCGDRATGKK